MYLISKYLDSGIFLYILVYSLVYSLKMLLESVSEALVYFYNISIGVIDSS